MKTARLYIPRKKGATVIKELSAHQSEIMSIEEFLRENMEELLGSHKTGKDIYNFLKEKGLVVNSYSWFTQRFAREKKSYLVTKQKESTPIKKRDQDEQNT